MFWRGVWGYLPANIVLTTSANAVVAKKGSMAYDASKADANHQVRELAIEMSPLVRVNAVARFGEIKVDVLDLGGKVVGNSRVAVRADGLDLGVEFEGDASEFVGKAVAIRFRLKNARLYSVWS